MLVNLQQRSNELELMDDPLIKEKDLKTALSDISRVNTMLGGNAITIKAIDSLIDTHKGKEITIVDFGCGDGEMLRSVATYFNKKNSTVKLIGVDVSDQSIEYAKKESKSYDNIQFMKLDVLKMHPAALECDIIICTLTLHHFTDEEIKQVLKKSVKIASIGVIINDLQRSKLAYYLFKLFSFFFIKGHVAKNDGLVSIKRGFKRKELIQYATQLKLRDYRLNWKWAFRYRWIIHTSHL